MWGQVHNIEILVCVWGQVYNIEILVCVWGQVYNIEILVCVWGRIHNIHFIGKSKQIKLKQDFFIWMELFKNMPH